MSVQALTWVLENSESRLGPRHVLISIANHADRLGKGAYPSIRTIAREARLSEREVQYAIPVLVKSKELSVEKGKGPGGTNVYSLPRMRRGAKFAGAQSLQVQTGVQNPPRNKELTKATVSTKTHPKVPPSPERVLTVRDRRHLNERIHALMSKHLDSFGHPAYQDGQRVQPVDFPEAVSLACAQLLIPVDAAWDSIRAAGLGDAQKKPPEAATA